MIMIGRAPAGVLDSGTAVLPVVGSPAPGWPSASADGLVQGIAEGGSDWGAVMGPE
jgi:hypothetical protein